MGAAAAGLLVTGLYLPGADAGGETRTMTLYSVNTKEKLTTTYMVNGRHVPAELKKINYLLRDWRRNAVTNMDTETIDLMWELHADLGSRAPIHIISGYRSAETNAMLKSIGRNVAKRSMHIQGKAIDLYFPDVPTERLRNSALVREVGGVGYYPRSGASGFIHVDSGRVRHWPGIGSTQLAKIHRDYRKTIGARLGRGQAVQVASAEKAEAGYPTPLPRPRPIEVLMMAAAQTVVQPVAAPAPVRNFAEAAARVKDSPATSPALETKADLSVAQAVMETKADMTLAQAAMEPKADFAVAQVIKPVSAPVPKANFAASASRTLDTLGTELEPNMGTDVVVARIVETPPPANASGQGNFLAALGGGIAAGAQDLLSWPAQLIRSAESLIWDRPSQEIASARESAPVEEAIEPFPPITQEDAAELEVIIAALRSRAEYDARNYRSAHARGPDAKADRLSDIRAKKGDLILTAPPPRYGAALPPQPVNQAVVQTFEKLLHETKSVE